MGSGSAAVYLLDSDDEDSDKNRNISDLISTLRTAYRTKDFDRVEGILVTKEAKLKRELQNIKKENTFLSEQCEIAKQESNRLENELSKQKAEKEELKRLVVMEKAAQDAAQVGEWKAVERYEKLLEEVKTGKRDEDKRVILELRKKCCVLECAKVRAESEVERWKRRLEELGIRVSKLEEDTAMLMDLGPQVSKKYDNNGSVKEKCSSGKRTNTVPVSIQDNGWLDCDENTSVAAGAGLNLRSPLPTKTDADLQCAASPTSASRAVVDILDSDDDHTPGETLLRRKACRDLTDKVRSRMLKRKQTAFINVSENINGGDHEGDDNKCPTSKRKMKQLQESIRDTDGSLANHCSDTTAFSGSRNVNKLVSSSRQDVCQNMNGSIPEVDGNIFPTSTRYMKKQEESIHDTEGCPANCCSATAVSSGCKNVDKVTSDSSCSSSDSDDEFISQRITKLQ